MIEYSKTPKINLPGMISQINIKKYLYFENVVLDFVEGLNVFTGETGAGKSLIIDAIGFVLGKKGNWENGTYVELTFENVQNEFSEEGLLILSREIKKGKSVFYINGKRATKSTILEASQNLVEIHGQHQQQNLFRQDFYRYILDKFAGIEDLINVYQRLYKKYKDLKRKEKEILEKQAERIRELDILRFQLNEIEEATIQKGEKEELERRYRYLSQIQNIKETVLNSLYILEEEESSILDRVNFIIKQIEKIKEISPSLEEIYTTLSEAKILLQESAFSMSNMELDFNYEEFQKLEERLNLINKLEIKYNTDENGLIKLKEEFKKRIEFLENLEFQLPEIQRELEEVEKKVYSLAEEISKIRREKSKELAENLKKHLKDLGFKEVSFIVLIEERELDRFGKDKISFLFSANKGFSPEPLSEVASGGEISRIALALKLIGGSNVECMIFDEIDTGLGGKTATLLAEKIKKLSENYQVFLITHLPQVAAYADKHFYIEKDYSGEKTKGIVKELDKERRKEEIARMLTGKINQESLFLAENLLSKK